MPYTTPSTTTSITSAMSANPQTAGLYVQPSSISDQRIPHSSSTDSSSDGLSANLQHPLAFPLKHTDVTATISGNISRVEVTQTFENPFTTPLEATYVFPLPDEAAVDTMTIRLGDRTIQGRIEKREEAQAIYEQAKQDGRTAGLLAQERANIFTQSLANIQPGEQIEVVITYSESLPYKQGQYEFVFPMVVGPRYIPGHPIEDTGLDHGSAPAPMSINQDTDQVPDASRLNGPIVPAGTRSGHDIQVTVEIDMGKGQGSGNTPGITLSNLYSPSHQIRVDRLDDLTRVTLAPKDTIPNKDLIVRYQVSGADTQTSVLTQVDERGGHFAIYLIPAIAYDSQQYLPKDMVFLIDTSGSQSGPPLAQCQALMRRFIDGLHPQDTFNIINFANTTQQLSKIPLDNTPQNRKRALKYVNGLRAGGGTEMLRGLKTVLNLPQLTRDRLRNVVLLTDGYIGNETQIFAEVKRSLAPATRLHSFGAGSSVNRFLLNRVAEFGRGISHIVRHDQPIDQVVDTFFSQINNPVLGNLTIQWDGEGHAPELHPMPPPDLFAEEPLVLFGRKGDRQPGVLHLRGIVGNGSPFEQSFAIDFEESGNGAIAQLWGRARIKELMNQMVSGETTQGVEAVTQTALTYQLLCQYTAFVAVSDEVRVEQPNEELSIHVPVNMPDGLSYDGVFGLLNSSPEGMASFASVTAPSPMVSAARPRLASPQKKELSRRSRAAKARPPASPPLASARPSAPTPSQPPSLVNRLGGLFKKKAKPPTNKAKRTPITPSPRPLEPNNLPFTPSERSEPSTEEQAHDGIDSSLIQRSYKAYGSGSSGSSAVPGHSEMRTNDYDYEYDEEPVGAVDDYEPIEEEEADDFRSNEPQPGGLNVASASAPLAYKLQLVEAKGLQDELYEQLQHHLQACQLSAPQVGLLMFDLVIKNGRVQRVMLDIEASDSQDPGVIYQLRQALLTWACPQLTLTSLRLKLQITS